MTKKKAISVWKYSCTRIKINKYYVLHPEFIAAPFSNGFISLKLSKEKLFGIDRSLIVNSSRMWRVIFCPSVSYMSFWKWSSCLRYLIISVKFYIVNRMVKMVLIIIWESSTIAGFSLNKDAPKSPDSYKSWFFDSTLVTMPMPSVSCLKTIRWRPEVFLFQCGVIFVL